jgi:cysteine desulfurase/selenocysteine lyase
MNGPMTDTLAPGAACRVDFPILNRTINGHPLVYLDSAATTQRPQPVVDAVTTAYLHTNANIHRGVHTLSIEATDLYESARRRIAAFLGASGSNNVIFCRGATEAINMVSQGVARNQLQPGDEVLITCLEHHSNIVPWQMVCEQTGATLVVADVDDHGALKLPELFAAISKAPKFVAVSHVSNVTGSVQDVAAICLAAREVGAISVIDGAQAAGRIPVDVASLGCDFYAISGHKMYGPTGIGCLLGRTEVLESMSPWQGGGEMIDHVSFSGTTYHQIPWRFEAGTPHIAGAIGLGAAVDYLGGMGMETVLAFEEEMTAILADRLLSAPGISIIANPSSRTGLVTFEVDGVHNHDVGAMLDQYGIAIRTGHHCAQPLLERLGLAGACRASIGIYTTPSDIDRLIEGLVKVQEVFAP